MKAYGLKQQSSIGQRSKTICWNQARENTREFVRCDLAGWRRNRSVTSAVGKRCCRLGKAQSDAPDLKKASQGRSQQAFVVPNVKGVQYPVRV